MHKTNYRIGKLNHSFNQSVSIEEVVKLFNQKISVSAIAKKLGCSRRCICNRLIHAGIKPRNHAESLSLIPRTPKKKYKSVHAWLKNNYGSANKCENIECLGTSNKYHWSLIYGKEYENNRANFRMLCTKCHRRYDSDNGLHEKQREASTINAKNMGLIYGKIMGKKYGAINGQKQCRLTDQQVQEIRNECLIGATRRNLAKKYNVSQTTITYAVTKKRYKWIQ